MTPKPGAACRTGRGPRSLAAAAAAALLLSGCSGWFGDDEPPPLPGTRIAVLDLARGLEPDPALAAVPVSLPPPSAVAEWTQPGGTPSHLVGHPALSATPSVAWRASIGSGSGGGRALLAQPVVAGGRVFAMDSDYRVTALDAATGRAAWSASAFPADESGAARGGGLAVAGGRVFATTGFGEAMAFDAATGAQAWRRRLPGPARSAPTAVDGRVFATTLDNQAVALDAATGEVIWSHTGIFETAGLLGGAAPAVGAGVAVLPFSSGDLVALRVENGRTVWTDSLTGVRRGAALSQLADIVGHPVIADGLVVAVGHGGRMAAVEPRTGGRAWELELGGVQTPWVAGDAVFVVTTGARLVALTLREGRVRWTTQLAAYADPERRGDRIAWAGPVLAGGRLWLANTRSELVAVDPETGDVLSSQPLPGPVAIQPAVAGGTMYVLTDGGELVALR
jgi:outer membrane protein assembly factor BamB